ncbi:MAG: hypothetical protein AAF253_00220 [Pseudomonadota bacterium]
MTNIHIHIHTETPNTAPATPRGRFNPLAIAKAATDLVNAISGAQARRTPIVARPSPAPMIKTPPVHTYRVIEARRRRATRRANRR